MTLTVEKDRDKFMELLEEASPGYTSKGHEDYPLILRIAIKDKEEEELRGLFEEYNAGKYGKGSDAFKSIHYEMVWITDPAGKRKIQRGAHQFLGGCTFLDILAECESIRSAATRRKAVISKDRKDLWREGYISDLTTL
jgi:hypothetical protein